MTNDSIQYQRLQRDAEEIVEKASTLLISYENSFSTVNQKDEGDMATSADIASEALIIKEIQKKYPNHSIISEEAGEIKGTEPYTWVVDPLDQTKEYSRHAGEYNCLIAVEHHGELVAGVTKRVGNRELYSCSKGNGAFLNGKPIHVSKTNAMNISIVSCYLPTNKFAEKEIKKDLAILTSIIYTCYRARGNNDEAKAIAWVAKGVYDGHILVHGGGKWHDIAPGILLIEEAGGKATDFSGGKVTKDTFSNGVIVSNGKIHDQLLNLVNK